MPVPTYDRFIEPVLRFLADHPDGASARDVHDAAATALGLTESDRAELLPSGVQTVYKNRAGWDMTGSNVPDSPRVSDVDSGDSRTRAGHSPLPTRHRCGKT